jgi:hypothetical protein
VTREFFFTLIQALKKQKLITTTSCGSAIDEGNDLKCFELLGTLCSVLYNQNQSRSEPLLLGNVFHPSFFELVKHALILSNEDILIKQGAVILRNVEPDYRPAFDLVLDPHHRGKIEAFRSLKIIFGLEGDDLSCAKQIVCQFIRPVQRFSKGLSKALSQIFSFHSSEELAILIQGRSLLKEEIIKALCPLGESSRDFETKFLWVKDWLLRASQEQCRGFVHAITGSENISDSLKIHVGASEDGSEHFTLRTCLNTILIPTNAAIDFDSFCLALEAVISSYEFNDK